MQPTDSSRSTVASSSECKKDGSSRTTAASSSECKKDSTSRSTAASSSECKKDGSSRSTVASSSECKKDNSSRSTAASSSECKKDGGGSRRSGSHSSRSGASTSEQRPAPRRPDPRQLHCPPPLSWRGPDRHRPLSKGSSRRSPPSRRSSRRCSPSRRSRSPGQHSRSPGRRSLSPGQRSRSPGRRSRSPGQRSSSPGRRSRSPGWCSRSEGQHTPSQHPESSVEQSLQIIVGNDCYVIDSPERKRTPDRLCSPVDSHLDRDDLADGPMFSRSIPPRSHGRYSSLEKNSSSPLSVRHDADYRSRDVFTHQSDYSINYDHLHDQTRETDNDGELLRKSLYPSEDRGREAEHARYDRDDRLLDMSIEPHGFMPATRNYSKRSLSRSPSPTYLDEDFRKLVNARRKREEEELSRNLSRKLPGSGYMMPSLTNRIQSSEPSDPWYLHRPVMPKKSILKKWVDDPSMQNTGSFLKQQETHELTSEPLDRQSDFLLPHERASQDGSGFSRILGMMTDSTSAQEKRRHSFMDDIEDEEKFLYGDDEDGSNVNFLSTQKLTLSEERESMSQKVSSSLLPSPSVKPDTSEASMPDDEKIHDLLMTIGLDIGVAEISKLAARTQERLHGKKPSRSPDRHLAASRKPESQERHKNQSNTHSLESSQKCSLSPSGSFPPSKDMSFVSNSEHNTNKTVGQDNPAGTPEQSVPLIPSAPPSLPAPTSFSWYGDPHLPPFPAIQVPQNYPPPTMPPPGYNVYGHYVPYADSGWPMYIPQADTTLSAAHGFVKPAVPPSPIQPNLRAIEIASLGKGTPDIQRPQSVLVRIPTHAPSSKLLTQSSVKAVKKKIPDERPRTSQKQRIIEEREKLKTQRETQQKKLHYLRIELNRLSKQQEEMLQKKRKPIDPLLVEVTRQKESIAKKVAQLEIIVGAAKKKQSELDKVAQILGINIFEKSQKLSSGKKGTEKNNSENAKSEERTFNPSKVSDAPPANGLPSVMALTPNQDSMQDTGQPLGPNPGGMQATAAKSRMQSVPGQSYTVESLPLRVWICGHSIPFWAQRHALMTGLGESLGIGHLVTARWFSKLDMEWDAMMPHLSELAVKELPPQMLVIHVGENDLAKITSTELIYSVIRDFHQIKTLFPDAMIVWVEMIPRRFWSSATHRASKEANHAISRAISQLGGHTIRQPLMNGYAAHLFRKDGIHLSRSGCDQYLKNLVKGITIIITQAVGELKGAERSWPLPVESGPVIGVV